MLVQQQMISYLKEIFPLNVSHADFSTWYLHEQIFPLIIIRITENPNTTKI